MVWLSITLGFAFEGLLEDSYIYPGGLHGYNVSLWIRSQIGAPGLILVLLATAILFGVALTRQTMGVVRKALHPQKGNNATMAEEATPQPEPTYQKPVMDEPEATAAEDESDKEDESEKKEKKESFWKSWTHRKPKQKKEEEEIPQEEEEKATEPIKEEAEKVVVKEEEPASELVIDLPIDTEEENDRKHPFEVKPALEDDFDKEEEEPVFEVSNDTKEEDQAYRGDMSQPYNPRLDLEFYRFPTLGTECQQEPHHQGAAQLRH